MNIGVQRRICASYSNAPPPSSATINAPKDVLLRALTGAWSSRVEGNAVKASWIAKDQRQGQFGSAFVFCIRRRKDIYRYQGLETMGNAKENNHLFRVPLFSTDFSSVNAHTPLPIPHRSQAYKQPPP